VSLAERPNLQAEESSDSTQAPARVPARSPWRDRILYPLFWLPVVLVTTMAIHTSVKTIVHRLTLQVPLNPWEAAIVVDSERVARGLPVYFEIGGEHATHMYGPLTNYLLGTIYRVTGPELWVGRAVNLSCAGMILVVILLGAIDRRRPLQWLLAIGFFIALHYKCRAYFTETRPDLIGAMLATFAFVAAYYAYTRDRLWLYVVSAALAVLAFLFKQPCAAIAAVPMLAVMLGRPPRMWRHLAFASLPLIALILTLLIMRTQFPLAYLYAVKAPSGFKVGWSRIVFAFMALWLYTPVYALCLAGDVLIRRTDLRKDPKRLWLHSACAIGGAAGVVAFAKHGGTYNSLLLGWIPMTAFILLTLPALIDRLYARLADDAPSDNAADGPGPVRVPIWDFTRLAYLGLFAVFLGSVVYTNHYGVPLAGRWAFDGGHGTSESRENMIKLVKRLDGKVLVPDDPTLTLHALDKLERSYDAEFDVANRRSPIAPYMVDWLRSARHIVRVESVFDNLTDEMMKELSFHRLTEDRPELLGIDQRVSVWQRRRRRPSRPATAPTTDSTQESIAETPARKVKRPERP
jgi:hypothetical protein